MLFGIGEKKYLEYSIALHVGVLLVFILGLPTILERTEPQPLVMTVEIVPIGEITNIKPSNKPIQKEKIAKVPVNKKPVPKAEEPKPKEPEPQPEPEKKDAVPLPEEKPKEKEKEKPKPKELEKEKPKPKEKEKPKENKKQDDDFAALLNKLDSEAKKEDKKPTDTEAQEENKTISDAPYDESLPLSITEKDMIKGQFIKCWNPPAGAKNAGELIVKVNINLQIDGTVIKAEIARDQLGRYGSDRFFRAAADSAIRAVWKCSPVKNLSQDKYGSWREMELTFDPSIFSY